jgi:hypothetical protein
VATALTVAAVALIVVGVAAVTIDPALPSAGPASHGDGHTVQSSTLGIMSPSLSVDLPTPSGEPGQTTPGPTPSYSPPVQPTGRPAGFVAKNGTITYYATDGTVVPVPPIQGLGLSLAEGKVTYFALSSNKYGLKTGSYAGEFEPNVTMQQPDGSSIQTGGAVLVGQVVNRLIAGAIAAYSAPADKWVVALPVDIRTGSNKSVDVSFDQFGLHGLIDAPRVVVRFSGKYPVVNVIPANAGYHVLVEEVGVTAWQVIDPVRLGLSPTKLDPDHPMNELLTYGSGTANVRRDVAVDRRVEIGRVMLTATDEVSVSLAVRDSRADLGPSRVLKIGDVPVFVAST